MTERIWGFERSRLGVGYLVCWRKLKRRGQRTMVAVDFRLRSDERAWFGRYDRPHAEMTVGRAIGMLMESDDARGFEIIIPRPVHCDEILRTRMSAR